MKTLFNFFTGFSLLLFLILPVSGTQFTTPGSLPPVASQPAQASRQADYGKMPLIFTPNLGQDDQQVAFTVQGRDKTIYFTETGLTIVFSAQIKTAEATGAAADKHTNPFQDRVAPVPVERWALKLDFVGARVVHPEGLKQTDTIVSYFKGKPDDWFTGIPTYARIVYPNLWPGIDLMYSGTYDRLKYEFSLHPGADPGQISLAYRSASAVHLDESGQLQVSTPLGDLQDEAPSAYQEINGKRTSVTTAYELQDSSFVFRLGAYDPSYSLVIDPAVLVYAGYLGGSGKDAGNGIAVDHDGAAYVTGSTESSNFPALSGPDLNYNGGEDAFVAKVKPDGSGLVYAGYLGGSGRDCGYGIAIDSNGTAYVTGLTGSSDFPTLSGPELTYNGGAYDAFIAKLNPDGSGLVYAGYLGGSGDDNGTGIAVDYSGVAYVTGHTTSSDFPTLGGPNLSYNGDTDAFVTKLKPDGSGLVYSGYLGGSQGDIGYGIAVDSKGAAYLTGQTFSSDFPVQGGPDLSYNGGNYGDAFVTKVKPDGSGLVYSSFLGGSGYDAGETGHGISVDDSGAAYVTGYTQSSDFPTFGGPGLTFNGGFSDAFVTKLKPDGSGLVYSGYLGGNGYDYGAGIAVDDSGAAYVTGFTGSSNFPTLDGPDLSGNGGLDAFVAKLKPDGSGLVYSSYLGACRGCRPQI